MHTGPRSSADPVEPLRYDFELSTRIETTLFGLDGEALDGPHPPPSTMRFEGQLEQSPARRFRDGSQGDRLRFIDVTLAQDGAEASPSDLSGLSVELRSFGDREILEIDNLDYIIGPGRHGDLLLGLWPALSPFVPDLEPGESTRQRSNLPFVLSDGMGMPVALDLDWTLAGAEACGADSCWRLVYRGPVQGKGRERNDRWLARFRLSGEAQGSLLVGQQDHGVRHSVIELELELLTILADPASQAPRGSIQQTWTQQVEITAEGTAP
jgi:hypothetical protein